MTTLYPMQPGSPIAYLDAGITGEDLVFVIDAVGILPAGPNLATIGSGATAEVVLYTSIEEADGHTTVTVDTRGYCGDGLGNGDAAVHSAGEPVSRRYTSYDHDSILTSIGEMPRSNTVLVAGDTANAYVKLRNDFQCAGTDDQITIQAAIDSLTAGRTWVETIKLSGLFNVTGSIAIPSYTKLDLTEAHIVWAPAAPADPLFVSQGTLGATPYYFLAPGMATTDYRFKLDPLYNIPFDTYVLLKSDANMSGATYPYGEIHRIIEPDPETHIEDAGPPIVYEPGYEDYNYLDTRPWLDYLNANSAEVLVVNMNRYIYITGGLIETTDALQSRLLSFTYVALFEISGLTAKNTLLMGMELVGCVAGKVYGNTIRNVADGDGIALRGPCNDLIISDNTMEVCQHGISGGTQDDVYGSPMSCLINNNMINGGTPTAAALYHDAPFSRSITYVSNNITGNCHGIDANATDWSVLSNRFTVLGMAINIINGISGNIDITNNTIYMCDKGVVVSAVGMAGRINIRNIYIERLSGEAISIEAGADTDVTISGVISVSGNTDASDLISIYAVGSIKIMHCILAMAQGAGIRIKDTLHGYVAHNICINNNQGGNAAPADMSGLSLVGSSDLSVLANVLSDDQLTPTQGYGIYEDAGCSGNLIAYNTAQNNITEQVLSLGTTPMINNNIGYVTRNIGTATIQSGESDTGDIPHGLSVVPDYVFITARTQEGASRAFVTAIGELSFRISISPAVAGIGGYDYYWKAVAGQA